jgi:hypothetical protein
MVKDGIEVEFYYYRIRQYVNETTPLVFTNIIMLTVLFLSVLLIMNSRFSFKLTNIAFSLQRKWGTLTLRLRSSSCLISVRHDRVVEELMGRRMAQDFAQSTTFLLL